MLVVEFVGPTEALGVALSIAFTLGRASIVGKDDPAAAAREL